MKSHVVLPLFIVLWTVMPAVTGCGSGEASLQNEMEVLLLQLDSAVERKGEIEVERLSSISRSKTMYKKAHDTMQRYDAMVDLYGEYDGFRLDSALEVANDALKLACAMGDSHKICQASIRVAQAYFKSGEYRHAIAILDTIPLEGMDYGTREGVYSAYFGSYHGMSKTALISEERDFAAHKAVDYRDSVIRLLSPNGIGHTYLIASRLYDNGKIDEAISMLENGSGRLRQNAASQYGIGMMYYENGQRDSALCALARASLLDLRDGKKEYMSLIALARMLYEDGDILRSFNYIRCAFEDAGFSHASIRTSEIVQLMPFIESAYRTYEDEVTARKQRYLVMALAFGVVLLVSLVVVYLQLRRISRIKHSLDIANDNLAKRNRQLAKADAEKLHQVDNLLQLHAANVANIKNYRRTLYNMMKSGQYSRVSDRLKSDSLDNNELRVFYDKFDSTFLSIFPDFMDEVNRYMKEPVAVPQSGRLTPELRIMALMRLGIENTADISMMLQYTTQTVYNYRSSIRNMLSCTLDEFAAAIRVSIEE